MKILNYILVVAVVFFFSCNGKKSGTETTNVAEENIKVPTFNSDSAYVWVEKQVSFGPRVPGSKEHEECAAWLEQKIKTYLPDVTVQSFSSKAYNGKTLNGKNIIASYKPETNNRIILCAHWDSRPNADHDPDEANRNKPVPAANDGASGVGVLMEVARIISINKPDLGIDIIFFDLEDYGEPQDYEPKGENSWCLGSQHWAKNPHKAGYYARYGILLDMVGAKGATFPKEGTSMYYASNIVDQVWGIAQKQGYSSFFINDRAGAITDDHLYINTIAQIPCIDIIQIDAQTGKFFPFWHTIKDDMSNIDKATLNAVGQVLLEVIWREKNPA